MGNPYELIVPRCRWCTPVNVVLINIYFHYRFSQVYLASLQLNMIAYHLLNWHNQSRKSFGKMQPIAVIMWTNWDITHWSLNKKFGLWQTMFCVALSRTTSFCLLLKWLEFVPDREHISLIVIYALVRCRIYLSQKWPLHSHPANASPVSQ